MKKRILIILCVVISPGLFSQADFRMMIESALEKGETNISIPTGTYTLMSEDYESVTLKGLKNISIDANGSTIICKKPSRAFDFINCENVRLANFSIDEGGDFRDIQIVDNKIVDCPFPAIVLAGIEGGELTGNIIEKSPDLVRNHGANFGFSNQDATSTMYLEDFIIEDNSVTIK
jgi:hypothetical protein